MQQLSIGAVARLTQIPAHTLRKWESRHGIAVPVRSETGRRVYTEKHVEQLRLVKQLVASGHSLAHLADLDIEQLQALAGLHDKPSKRPSAQRIALIGPNLSRLLTGESSVTARYPQAIQEWLTLHLDMDAETSYVVETATLPPELVEALTQRRRKVALLVVVYSFASSLTLQRLSDADILAIHGPVSQADLLRYIEPTPAVESRPLREHRFSDLELARIAALNPGLKCECPNHIAQLLMDISAFERYSRECIESDPGEKSLHQHLGDISARARELFEDALVAVASADGIALTTRD